MSSFSVYDEGVKYIFDGQNIAHRAFWVASNRTQSSNTKELALFMFLNSLKSNIRAFGYCEEIWIAWDKKEIWPSTNFRKTLLGEVYKDGRNREHTDDLFKVTELAIEITNLLGIKNLFPYVLEADDCISWLVQKTREENKVLIVSADKDLLQLTKFPNTSMFSLGKKKLFDSIIFEKEYGFHPSKFALFKAITGDKSDNITGIGRYGEKRALSLILEQTWEDLTKEQLRTLKKNLEAVDLTESFLKEENEESHYIKQEREQRQKQPDWDKAFDFFVANNFSKPEKDVEDWKDIWNAFKMSTLFTSNDK